MLALPLLAATLALAPTGASSRVELDGSLEFDAAAFTLAQPTSSGDGGLGLGGQGAAGFTLFGRRIVDDDAPPTLQPYLQRAAQLSVGGGGGAIDFQRNGTPPLPDSYRTLGHADVTASGYADRFYGYLGFGVRYLSQTGPLTSLALPVDVAAGVRFGDTRVLLGYNLTPTQYNGDVFRVPFWWGLYARLYSVVERRVSLAAGVFVREGGVAIDGGATLYVARRLGVGFTVSGAHGSNAALRYDYDDAGGSLGVEAWTGPRLAVALAASFEWTRYAYDNGTGETDYTTVVSLSFRVRPR